MRTLTTKSATMRYGIHGFGIRISDVTGGVYRDDECTPRSFSSGLAMRCSPGRVPFGVVRPPPVLRFGGATVDQSRARAVRPEREPSTPARTPHG